MNDELIRGLFKLKLQVMDSLTDKLPGHLGDNVRGLKTKFIELINTETNEYLENKRNITKDNSIKKVTVE